MKTQLTHHTTSFTLKKFPIILVCDHVSAPANIGGIFRLADSFGVSEIYFCGHSIDIESNRMKRTSRATHKTVTYHQNTDTLETIMQYKEKGYTLLALEITKESIPLTAYSISPTDKIVLVIGEENLGISESVLTVIDHHIHIPMYGNNSSMNVTSATGIALYEITKQLNS